MNNQVSSLAVEGKITELSEDIEVVSPGSMLREARQGLSISQEHIASKLNFKLSLVQAIEEDQFDPKVPVTFNRGYLVNYAKLVSIDAEDVLASYEALDAASIQRSEMLSFSKETSKQAEHSRVMWISYLIAALLIGLTILWWTQQSYQQTDVITQKTLNQKTVDSTQLIKKVEKISESEFNNNSPITTNNADIMTTENQTNNILSEQGTALVDQKKRSQIAGNSNFIEAQPSKIIEQKLLDKARLLSKAVFTFKGDCWVNIYDADNKRVAWGVKKAGYVMTVEGQAPFQVTVGKPELTSIIFNDLPIDMSSYNDGNIAKFTLPIIIE
jgi:cytoskeleton protein RodZ